VSHGIIESNPIKLQRIEKEPFPSRCGSEMEKSGGEIDEGLYSRQLYVFGHEAQARMQSSDVLLVGLNGLGAEAAKNVILSGVKSVTLHDTKNVSYTDLSANFYLSEVDIGKNRAEACVHKMAELNQYVAVSTLKTDLSDEVLMAFGVVVLIDVDLKKQLEVAAFCHANNIAFIAADAFGLFGSIFCDFGTDFVVHDTDGEAAATSMVTSITEDEGAIIVTTLEETRHNLETGDHVILSDIVGLERLNDKEYRVVITSPFSFQINPLEGQARIDISGATYVRGGYVTQVKQPVKITFDAMDVSQRQPGMFCSDIMKMDKAGAQHVTRQALHAFVASRGSFPKPGSADDAAEVYRLVCDINAGVADGDFRLDDSELEQHKGMIEDIARTAAGHISPVCALLGGVLGQEILKACSGKFMPVKQWYYYDCLEALPDSPLSETEVAPKGCRYDGQIMVFGTSLQERIFALNCFLVGAGAIGCEMLKNWSMMGVACGSGRVYVTDMDTIEKSNLSRQFLFRTSDINSLKSTTAIKAAMGMNPTFRGQAYEHKVAKDTEHIFDDDFFESLDMVCTALDNVEARLYVDQRCLFYHKPMLESGTLGTKGNTQVVLPGKTEHYGATRDPAEKSVPVCTLKNFPNQIEHTLQWARDWFEGIYKQAMDDCNAYLTSVDGSFLKSLESQQNMKLETVTRMHQTLKVERPQSFAECVSWARLVFEDLFTNKIKQLLHSFPEDRLTSEGTPFWSGAKKPPTPLEFSANDAAHMEFIKASANLRALCYHIPGTSEDAAIREALDATMVPDFSPSSEVKIATTEAEAKEQKDIPTKSFSTSEEIDAECQRMLGELPAPVELPAGAPTPLTAIDFDKDIDEHMRVVAACSNLRARNYKIPEADLHKSRGIAGKIIPAIATTTGLVAGAISLELFKVLLDKPIEKFAMTFCNLALPFFATSEPNPPTKTTTIVNGTHWLWSQWDRIDVDLGSPAMTIQGLIDYVQDKYGLEMVMLNSDVSMLFTDFMSGAKRKDRLAMTLKQAYETVTKTEVPAAQKYLILSILCMDEEGEDVDLPYLRVKLF